jgi:tetratricopeptide (TPR) repeat protein
VFAPLTRYAVIALLLMGELSLAAQEAIPDTIIRQVSRILERVEENPQAAIDDLADLLERRRRSPAVQAYIVRQKAALLIREQQIEQARDDLFGVLDGQEESFALPLRLMLGQALLMLDDYSRGLQQLETWAANEQTPDPTGLFLLGYGYLRMDQLDLAIARLEDAMANLEEIPRSHWIELLAYAYARADRPADAQRLMEDLIARDPSEERWWRQLAAVLLLLEDVPRGTAALSLAEQIKPESFEQTRRLARFLAHAGLPADAAELLAAALEQVDNQGETPPTDARSSTDAAADYLLLAEMWVLAREFDAAIASLEVAETMNPDDGKPAMVMGQLYLHWEQYQSASQALDRAAAVYALAEPEETHAQVNYLLAIAHINLKQYDAALVALDRLAGDKAYDKRGAALERFIANRQEMSR